jgi:hypothetical protein
MNNRPPINIQLARHFQLSNHISAVFSVEERDNDAAGVREVPLETTEALHSRNAGFRHMKMRSSAENTAVLPNSECKTRLNTMLLSVLQRVRHFHG